MNCENCKHWIYGYCRLLDCRREKDFLCNAWELSVSYERTAKMTAELEMSLTDKLLESRRSPETLLARTAELSQAIGLITTLNPTIVMDIEHPLDMAKEVAEYVSARIAELEAENADLRDCIEIMEDACDILRKENFRLFQQIFADETWRELVAEWNKSDL